MSSRSCGILGPILTHILVPSALVKLLFLARMYCLILTERIVEARPLSESVRRARLSLAWATMQLEVRPPVHRGDEPHGADVQKILSDHRRCQLQNRG